MHGDRAEKTKAEKTDADERQISRRQMCQANGPKADVAGKTDRRRPSGSIGTQESRLES